LFTRTAVTFIAQHFLCVSSCPCMTAKSHNCVTETAHGYLLQDYWGRMGLFALGGNVARTYFWWRDMKERHRFQDIGVNQKMILIKNDLIDIGWEGVVEINLPQDGARWRAVVETVMNIGVV
jgi:hypothetical protein